MSDRRPYSRVYWSVLEDEKFDAIRCDMRHFGAWALLLIVADMAYPAPAFVPPGVPKRSLAALVDAHLVDLLTAGRYRIHGLAAERKRRTDAGNAGASARWSERNANASQAQSERNANGLLDEDETRQDETRHRQKSAPATGMEPVATILPRVEDVGISEGEGRVFAFLARFGAAVREDSPLGRRLLGLIERRGVEDVLRHAGVLSRNGPMSDRQWVLGLENAMERIPDANEGRAIDREEERQKHSERVQAAMAARRAEAERWLKPEPAA